MSEPTTHPSVLLFPSATFLIPKQNAFARDSFKIFCLLMKRFSQNLHYGSVPVVFTVLIERSYIRSKSSS
jgi:hypothetical protein